jgi:hypothetical protein
VAETTTHAPLDLAAELDGASAFLCALADTPQYEDRRDGIMQLVGSIATARNRVEKEHDLTELEVEQRQEARMQELGLYEGGIPNADPSGGDVAYVDDKLESLARDVIGVEWNRDRRAWARDA